jgi:5-methylcytosine-specific restriction endonuclease McrA
VHMSLDKHWNWQGGKSFEPYAPSWNSQVKERIRVRDNFTCQVCKVPELEFNRKLDVHHIDYNKKNCKENNLVSLCNSCHTKTNKNRKYWKNYFNQMLHNIKEVLPCCL